jgi:hypothetical protein
MVMTASVRDEFHEARICAVTTLVCDAQHENIDFAGDSAATIRGQGMLLPVSVLVGAECKAHHQRPSGSALASA